MTDCVSPSASFPIAPGRLANGIQIFPGSVPIYKSGVLVGALGISGDGVDQDDMVAFLGVNNAERGAAGRSQECAEGPARRSRAHHPGRQPDPETALCAVSGGPLHRQRRTDTMQRQITVGGIARRARPWGFAALPLVLFGAQPAWPDEAAPKVPVVRTTVSDAQETSAGRCVGPGVTPPSRRARGDCPHSRARGTARRAHRRGRTPSSRRTTRAARPRGRGVAGPEPGDRLGAHPAPGAGRTRRFPADPGPLAPGQGPGPREGTLVRPL